MGKIHLHTAIDGNVEILVNGLFQQIRTAVGVGGIDAVASVAGDGNIQIPEEGCHGQLPGIFVVGTQDHGVRTGLGLAFSLTGILADQQNVCKSAVCSADPAGAAVGKRKLGKYCLNAVVLFHGSIVDLFQIAAEKQRCAQQEYQDKSQQGAKQFHGFPGKGIFSLHNVTEILL